MHHRLLCCCLVPVVAACGGGGGGGNGGGAVSPLGRVAPGFPDGLPYQRWGIAGDLDLDGRPEVFFGEQMYRNFGGGSFATWAMPFRGSAAAFGDVDGDGDLDVVLLTSSPAGSTANTEMKLWRNAGDATFTAAPASEFPTGIGGVEDTRLCDLDGDGDLDAVLSKATHSDRVLVNTGGSFEDRTSTWMPAGTQGHRIAVADFDGDGDVDVLQVSSSRLLRNTGHSFEVGGSLPPLYSQQFEYDVAVGDLDADGDVDVAIVVAVDFVATHYVRRWINDGTGQFTFVPTPLGVPNVDVAGVAIADVDMDGDADILVTSPPYLLRNDGAGSFTPEFVGISFGNCVWGACLFDADADGDLDVAVGSYPGIDCTSVSTPSLALNDGTGHFQHPGASSGSASVFLAEDVRLVQESSAAATLRFVLTHRADAFSQGGLASVWFALERAASPTHTPFGSLDLVPEATVQLPPVLLRSQDVAAQVSVPVPAIPSFAGIVLHAQAVVVDPTTGRGRFTPPVESRIGR